MPQPPLRRLNRQMLGQIASINLDQLKAGLDALLAIDNGIRRVLLISPVGEDYRFIRRHYPQFDLYITEIDDWNLDERCPLRLGHFDLAIASNVMMYSHAPQRWIDHVLEVSRHFAMQDLVYRKRGANPPHLGRDNDAVRYCHSSRGVQSPFAKPFDLGLVPQPMAYFKTYSGGLNEFHQDDDTPVHFVAIVSSISPRQQAFQHSRWQAWRFKARNLAFTHEVLHKSYRTLSKARRWMHRP